MNKDLRERLGGILSEAYDDGLRAGRLDQGRMVGQILVVCAEAAKEAIHKEYEQRFKHYLQVTDVALSEGIINSTIDSALIGDKDE
ncbi:MAG: hypothetical protein ABFS03_00720 [Chloroflexota bacterium]